MRFGIQEKTALLVTVVAVVAATGTVTFLSRISREMVVKHEKIDLSDEASLRAWEIIDQFNTFREEIGQIATANEVREAVWGSEIDQIPESALETIASLGQGESRQWEQYLWVQIVDGNAIDYDNNVVKRVRRIDDWQKTALVVQTACEDRKTALVTEISRKSAAVENINE